MKITGVRSTGGSAPASSAPSSKPQPIAPPARQRGKLLREPAAAASRSGRRDERAAPRLQALAAPLPPARGRQAAHAQPLDAPRIGVEHLEFDAVGMGDDLAAFRHPAGQHEDEAAQRVDRLLVAGRAQARAVLFLERLDRQARIGDDAAVGPLDQRRRLGDVVLVLDLADDLLDQILDRHQPVDAAELVDDHRDVGARLAHLHEQIEDRQRGGDEQHLAQQAATACPGGGRRPAPARP